MRKFYFFIGLVFLCGAAFSQALFNNNGADIFLKVGGLFIVTNNTISPATTGSLYNNASNGQGLIYNEGTIVVEGYIKNDDSIVGNGDTIRLTGSWINDQTYIGNNSWVDMYGG